jgi:hypothetical protein
MCSSCLLALLLVAQAPANEVLISDPGDGRIEHSPDFAVTPCPYALAGSYLKAPAGRAGAPAGSIRIAAPVGRYYVYVAWTRHPNGAKDVRVKVGGAEVRVDQSRLANGKMPGDFDRNDWQGEVCTSGLYRITEKPVDLQKSDAITVFRSDTTPGTYTTFEYVLFSPSLYLDDLGNDVVWSGRPLINAKNYGKDFSAQIGWGAAILPSDQPQAAFEWTVPAEGRYVVSVQANRGPNRAAAAPLEIELGKGNVIARKCGQKAERFGRAEWEQVALIEARRGTKLRVRAANDGCVLPDLLRLTPIAASEIIDRRARGFETFTIQWEAASTKRPWLKDVRIVPTAGVDAAVEPFALGQEMPHAARVKVARRWLPLLGGKENRGLAQPAEGSLCVKLADDYGYTLSADLLRREPFVWLRDLGMFACAQGDFASHAAERRVLSGHVEAARKEPFRSTSEQYLKWTGYDELRATQDDRAYEFAYHVPRRPQPRVNESIEALPEVDYAYFVPRVQDFKNRRTYLGWPNVCRHFYVLSNGAIGGGAGSSIGTGHPPAEDFLMQFGAGESPLFRAHCDASVTQSLEDGYHIVVHTRWQQGKNDVHATAFAYPLAGEEVRTGIEPLASFVRLHRTSGKAPLWVKVTTDHVGDCLGAGPALPLAGLGEARLENGRLLTGNRIVLAVDHADATVVSAKEREVVLKIVPKESAVDFVVPYVAVEKRLIEGAQNLGFDKALVAVKRYWDRRLAKGARVDVPDPVVVNQYKTLLPRALNTADLDVHGDYAMKTSPLVYEYVWMVATADAIEGLSRRGHFDEAKQYLEAGFHWQGSQASDASATYSDWKGFFTAPKYYTALLWLNSHGWFQWAAARYYLYSDDRAWLERKLPALLKSLEWTTAQRKATMHDNPDGTRPPNYGWLPPGRVTDGSSGTSTFTDCIDWMGANELVCVLERIGHPRAKEFRQMVDDYRRCIVRGLRLATRGREPVRLNDGTYIPFVPGYLESLGHEESIWYDAEVDGALVGILDSAMLDPTDPMENWVLANLEDNLFVLAPNMADEGHYIGQVFAYLRRDQPKHAIYTFYSLLTSQCSRQTLTTVEERSWGWSRVYDLAPWAFGYYTRTLAGMLANDEGRQMFYCQAMPRKWLDARKTIRVENLQTRFGPTSLKLTSEEDRIVGFVDPPTRYAASAIKLRLRVNGRIEWVKLNGQPAEFDRTLETVRLPDGVRRIEIEAGVQRGK